MNYSVAQKSTFWYFLGSGNLFLNMFPLRVIFKEKIDFEHSRALEMLL
jgi:hypothetical protein